MPRINSLLGNFHKITFDHKQTLLHDADKKLDQIESEWKENDAYRMLLEPCINSFRVCIGRKKARVPFGCGLNPIQEELEETDSL